MIIRYIGTDKNLQNIRQIINGSAEITSLNVERKSADIYEVSSLEVLYKIPKHFDIPSYFYITTKDEKVMTRIKEYSVSGIFFPPLKQESLIEKIKQTANRILVNPADSTNYDGIRIKILAKSENIPPLPDFANQLIALTRKDSSTIKEVTDKIKMDQGMSARIIKLINTPFYGVRQEISSIDRATVLLGFNSVKNIAMALSIDNFFKKHFEMYEMTGKAMWMHSYKTACIAQEIAKEISYDPDSLYLGGLLHDIGKVVMVDFLVKAVKYPEDERIQLGFDHAEIGSVILNKWSVIPRICDAVKNHHNPKAESISSKILFYANEIANNEKDAENIIDETGIILGLTDTKRLKKIILPFLRENNVEI